MFLGGRLISVSEFIALPLVNDRAKLIKCEIASGKGGSRVWSPIVVIKIRDYCGSGWRIV
jgi:hypothetical protein